MKTESFPYNESVGLLLVNDRYIAVVGDFVSEIEVVVESDGRVFNADFAAIGAWFVDAIGEMAIAVATGRDVNGGDGLLLIVNVQFHRYFLHLFATVIVNAGNQSHGVVQLEDGGQEPTAVDTHIADHLRRRRNKPDMGGRVIAEH